MTKEKKKKKTETYSDIAMKEGMTSGRALKAKAVEMIPFVGFSREVKRTREEAKEKGTKPLKEFTDRKKKQLDWGMKKAVKIGTDPTGAVIDENPTAKEAKKEVDAVKDQAESYKKDFEQINQNMSKPVQVSASTPRSKSGKPYRKPQHTRKKPKRK